MKRAILAVLLSLALPAMAVDPCVDCPSVKRVLREPFKCKPGLQKVTCNGQHRCLPVKKDKPVVTVCPEPTPQPVPEPRIVIIEVPATAPPPTASVPSQREPNCWHLGPYFQMGSGISEPRNVFTRRFSSDFNGGLLEFDVGFHAHYLPSRLGAHAYYAGNLGTGSGYGLGGQVEYYVWQGEGLEVHLDAGALWTGGPF